MTETSSAREMPDPMQATRERLVEAMLPHVPFDGWSEEALDLAVAETGIPQAEAKLAFPRGPIDMALAFHRWGDRKLDADLDAAELISMRMRERVTHCVRRRIELIMDHREAVRRGAALFALPQHSVEGARAIWETADLIWTRCGDTAEDYNWYTKRAILASVYSSTVLYWLGDSDPRAEATWEFLGRRIDNVMQFERFKGKVQKNPLAKLAMWGPSQFLKLVRAPGATDRRSEADPDKVEPSPSHYPGRVPPTEA